MVISINQIKNKIGIKGTDLNSREWGEQIRQEISKIIHKKKINNDIIYLDFDKITSFNSSIADEVIVTLTKETIQQNKNYYIISQNIPENSKYDLELVTSHRKIPCLLKKPNKKQPEVICGENASKMERNQITVYDLVARLGKTTSRQIADIMKKDIHIVSIYLNRLFKLHLLKRKEEIDTKGKQYVYRIVA